MILAALLVSVFVCAVVPAVMFCLNLRAYAPPPPLLADEPAQRVAVLIPARNEEANIAAALECVLASVRVELEIYVMDDASTDRTAAIVAELALRDERVYLLRGGVLPAGWNGKQHACWRLAEAATAPTLLFLDADVRVGPQAIARMAAFQRTIGAALVSGFPQLITISWLEKLLLPLIHFVLLGFLPIAWMRRTTKPSLAAGCGQFQMVNRAAYFKCGGHEAIKATMHDGLLLPRAFRSHGFRTDLADITELASVRMYRNAREVWNGLAKNATEGLGAPKRIVPLSLMLVLGQVVPTLLLVGWAFLLVMLHIDTFGDFYWMPRLSAISTILAVVTAASYIPAFLIRRRFKQPFVSALLHPFGIVLLLCVQWYALVRQIFGRPVGWRQREYAPDTGSQVN